jgi:diketogulonate reductase-like aldo/keto reductase
MAGMDTGVGAKREVTLPSGEDVPALGLGTWRYGESASSANAEVSALRLALEIGYRVFDTAEMYGDGGAETVLGRALAQALRGAIAREQVFVVSKVLPENASTAGVLKACERSLQRLQLDHIDLYLLHWRGSVPLKDTIDGFEILQQRGWIRHWGVSNFDLDDLRELHACPGSAACSTNQVWYSLGERGPEFELLPWQRLHQLPLMAYSPIDQGELVDHAALHAVAQRHAATPAQVALAWVLAQPGVMAIPKAVHAVHLRHNWQALKLRLSPADHAELDRAFAPPSRRRPLAMR